MFKNCGIDGDFSRAPLCVYILKVDGVYTHTHTQRRQLYSVSFHTKTGTDETLLTQITCLIAILISSPLNQPSVLLNHRVWMVPMRKIKRNERPLFVQQRTFGSCALSQINTLVIEYLRMGHSQFSCKLCGFVDIITARLRTHWVETEKWGAIDTHNSISVNVSEFRAELMIGSVINRMTTASSLLCAETLWSCLERHEMMKWDQASICKITWNCSRCCK